MAEEFEGTLVCEQVGAWTYVPVPAEVATRLGGQARIPVVGEVNGTSFTGSVMTGPTGPYIVVNKTVREAVGVSAGDHVRVTVSTDAAARSVDVPDDLAAALSERPESETFFEKLSYSRKKEYVTWLESAKQAATRQRRLAQAIEKLAAGQVLK